MVAADFPPEPWLLPHRGSCFRWQTYGLVLDVTAVLNAKRRDINYKYIAEQVTPMARVTFSINDSGASNWTIASLQAELSANNNLGLS